MLATNMGPTTHGRRGWGHKGKVRKITITSISKAESLDLRPRWRLLGPHFGTLRHDERWTNVVCSHVQGVTKKRAAPSWCQIGHIEMRMLALRKAARAVLNVARWVIPGQCRPIRLRVPQQHPRSPKAKLPTPLIYAVSRTLKSKVHHNAIAKCGQGHHICDRDNSQYQDTVC